MSRLSTVNRRAFVGVTAALFTPAAAHARNLRQTGLKGESTEPSDTGSTTESQLLIGGGDSLGMIYTIGVLDGSGNLIETIEGDDSIFAARTTPNSRRVVLDLMLGTAFLDLNTGEQSSFDDVPQLLVPKPAVDGPASIGANHLIATTFAFDSVMQLDIESGTLTNITEYLQGDSQEMIPASATFSPSGALAGVWTGNNVYLLDPAAPENAIALNGGDDSLYSTAFSISQNEEWIAYTTYSTSDGLGEVILQSTVDGTPIPVVKGDAWSCIQFLPGDDSSFLLLHEGTIERRTISDPTVAGESLGEVGVQPLAESVTTADGAIRIISSRTSDSAPVEWTLLDLNANTGTPLPDLSGLDLLPVSTWQQEPVHALFGSQPEAFSTELRPGPVVGLNLASGKIIPLLEDVALDSLVSHTTTTNGSQVFLNNHPESPEPALWYLDLTEGTAIEITSTRDAMINGCLAPDGTLAAVTGRDENYDSEVFLCDPADPSELDSFGSGVALTWT